MTNIYIIANEVKYGGEINRVQYINDREKRLLELFDNDDEIIYWNKNDIEIKYYNSLIDQEIVESIDYHAIFKSGHNKLIEHLYTFTDQENISIEILSDDQLITLSEDEFLDYQIKFLEAETSLNRYKAICKYCEKTGVKFFFLSDNGFFELKLNYEERYN